MLRKASHLLFKARPMRALALLFLIFASTSFSSAPARAAAKDPSLKIQLRQKELKKIRPTPRAKKKPLEAKDIPFDPVKDDVISNFYSPRYRDQALQYGENSILVRDSINDSPDVLHMQAAELQKVMDVFDHVRRNDLRIDDKEALFLGNLAADRAFKYLLASGIWVAAEYFLKEGKIRVRILPQGDHPLNRFAARMSEKYRSKGVYYDPVLLFRRDFDAAIFKSNRSLMISHQMMASQKLRDTPLLHEIAHLLTLVRMDRRELRGEYGTTESDPDAPDSRLPLPILDEYYGKYLSHDEIETYFRTSKHDWRALSRNLKSGADPESSLNTLEATVHLGVAVSARTLKIAELLFKVPPEKMRIEYFRERAPDQKNLVYAKIRWETPATGRLITTIPLVQAEDILDKKTNLRLAREQLGRLRDQARYRRGQFQVMRRAVSRIRENPDPKRRLKLVRAIRLSLLMKEHDGHFPTLQELIDRYNRAID